MFKYYVLNYNHNENKIEYFNIFRNINVYDRTLKAVKKYLRAPSKFVYKTYFNDEEEIYGFDGFVKELDSIIKWQEWGRCEYEIAVGSIFTPEAFDVLRDVNSFIDDGKDIGNLKTHLEKTVKVRGRLEKWDCYRQCKPNMKIIAREVIRQYKEAVIKNKIKNKGE